jgi:Holliday junction resolvase YEN1
MFGCDFLIRTFYEKGGKGNGPKNGPKSKSHVRVYHADAIYEKTRLDRFGIFLFAVLCGGDYDTKGLPGCGSRTAWQVAQKGLGLCLFHASPSELSGWRQLLRAGLGSRNIQVPETFPDLKALKHYRSPAVSTSDELSRIQLRMDNEYQKYFCEPELRLFLLEIFNQQTDGYIRHILPLLLLKALRGSRSGLELANNIFQIEVVISRPSKNTAKDSMEPKYEKKIRFLPQPVTNEKLSLQPSNENWDELVRAGMAFNALKPVETELLECILRKAVPQVLAAEEQALLLRKTKSKKAKINQSTGSKRKIIATDELNEYETAVAAPSKKRKSSANTDARQDAATERSRANRATKPMDNSASTTTLNGSQPLRTKSFERPVFKMPEFPTFLNLYGLSDTEESTQSLEKANPAVSTASTALSADPWFSSMPPEPTKYKNSLGGRDNPIDLTD